MNTVVFLTAIMTFYQDVSASEEAVALIVKAFEHRGDNPALIQTGTAEFDVATKNISNDAANSSNTHIKVLMLGNNIRSERDNPSNCKRLLAETYFSSESSEKIGDVFTISMGHENQSDSYVAFEWKPASLLLTRFRGVRDIRPIPEFQKFGRFQFLPSELLAILTARITKKELTKKDYQYPDDLFTKNAVEVLQEGLKSKGLTYEITGEVKYDVNATAKVIEIKKGETCVEKYHIDIERGYLCSYLWNGNENAAFEFSAKDYIQESQTSLYYPKTYSYSTNMPKINVSQTQEFRLVANSLRFNQPISDKEFSLDIPAGSYVHDRLPLKSFMGLTGSEVADLLSKEKKEREIVTYRTSQKGTVSFADDSYNIEKQSWMVPMETHKTKEEVLVKIEEQKQSGNSYYRVGYILFGILLIIIALWLMRKWKG